MNELINLFVILPEKISEGTLRLYIEVCNGRGRPSLALLGCVSCRKGTLT